MFGVQALGCLLEPDLYLRKQQPGVEFETVEQRAF
jgi:hypothetical protein